MADVLANTLPELRTAEKGLREAARSRYGIVYVIREGRPHYAGLRTPADTAQLLKWRDDAVAAARKAAESKRRQGGGSPVQVRAAGDVAASRAHYRVSPYGLGKHPVGGAFDIWILNVGSSPAVQRARGLAETERKRQGGSAVQVKAAGNVAAEKAAYKLVGDMAPQFGLTWGGIFIDNPGTSVIEQPDPWHFELREPRSQLGLRFQALQRRPTGGGSGAVIGVVLLAGLGLWFLSRPA